LLLMNLLIRIKNTMTEESKLMKERYLTMSKVSNKFIKNNKKLYLIGFLVYLLLR